MIISTEINNVAEHDTFKVICTFVFYGTHLEKETRGGGGVRSINLNNSNTFECARLICRLACLHDHCLTIYLRHYENVLSFPKDETQETKGFNLVLTCYRMRRF